MNYLERQEATKKMLATNKEPLLKVLRELGAARVIISYSGSGDDGHFEDALITGKDDKILDVGEAVVTVNKLSTRVTADGFSEEIREEEQDLEDALLDFAHEWVYSQHGGWENNDGGAGEITISVESGEFSLVHSELYVESTEYEYTL